LFFYRKAVDLEAEIFWSDKTWSEDVEDGRDDLLPDPAKLLEVLDRPLELLSSEI
jgi:hypothetical protein